MKATEIIETLKRKIEDEGMDFDVIVTIEDSDNYISSFEIDDITGLHLYNGEKKFMYLQANKSTSF